MSSIRERIGAGEFKPQMAYPTKPVSPPVLGKTVRNLTDEEIQSLPSVRRTYEEAMQAYRENQKAYSAENAGCGTRFKEALEEEYGTKGHPKANRLYGIAYEKGHSGGFTQVFEEYESMVDLLV